jgi:uncharacterized BrkB/YihY/UPF0761 family membrane protein
LQDALNAIWKIEPRAGLGILALARSYLLSFVVVLATGILLLAELTASVLVFTLTRVLDLGSARIVLAHAVNLGLCFVLVAVLFALIHKVLPDARVAWADILVGALFTSLLYLLGKYAITLYLAYSTLDSAYGAAGSLVVTLCWVYYSALIFLLGTQFTHALAVRRGGAVPRVKEETLEVPGQEVTCTPRSGAETKEGTEVVHKLWLGEKVTAGKVERTRVIRQDDKVIAETTISLQPTKAPVSQRPDAPAPRRQETGP